MIVQRMPYTLGSSRGLGLNRVRPRIAVGRNFGLAGCAEMA